jgi:hypothetical protein
LREVFVAAGQGDAALGTRGIAIPLTGKDGERYIAHALPLTSGARRRAGIGYPAVAACSFARRPWRCRLVPKPSARCSN